jgi:hypothetical protein
VTVELETKLGDGLDRLDLIRALGRRSYLELGHTRISEQAGDLDLLDACEGHARCLLSVTERGVDDVGTVRTGRPCLPPGHATIMPIPDRCCGFSRMQPGPARATLHA